MAEIATLGLRIDAKDADRAATSLDRFSESAKRSEGAVKATEGAARRAATANDNVSGSAQRAASAYHTLAGAAQRYSAAIAGTAIGAALTAAIGRLREMEQVDAQVNKALENAGTMAGHSAESIRRWADEIEKSTGRAASEVMAVSANLASFGFNEDVFFRAIKLADDMSAAWGGDLRQNLEGLSRALENPEKGLAMLSARGITFTKEGRALAIRLAEIGDSAGAAAVLMDELESQVAGVAQAGFTGLTKASTEARRTMNLFFETIVTRSGVMTAMDVSLNGAAIGMTFLADNAELVMLAVGVLTARIAGPFVAAQVTATATILKKNAALLAQTTALYRNVTAANAMAFAARGLSTSLALVGGSAGAAILAIGAALYIASQRAQDARDRSERYADIIRRAGENSATAGMGIREAAAALHEVEKAATAAETAVSRFTAHRELEAAFRGINEETFKLAVALRMDGLSFDAADRIRRETHALTDQFKAGRIPVEDFIKEIDKISTANPNASGIIAEIQKIAREAAVAMGILDALNNTIAETLTTPKTSRLGAPAPLSDMDFAHRTGGWEGIFPDLFKETKSGRARMSEAEREAKRLEKAYDDLTATAAEFIASQQLEASLIGMTEQEANALRYEFDLLNEARRAGITLTDADKAGFKALAEAMAEAEANTRQLKEAFDFVQGTIKGFFSDLRSGLMEGKSFFEALGQAGLNAINKIADRLLDLAMDQMINGFLRNLMGAFGGAFGGGPSGFTAGLPFPAAPGVGLFDSGGVHMGSNIIPFGPNTRSLGNGLLADSGFGPRHFPAMLEYGESVLTRKMMGRTMRTINGLAANQNHANQNGGRGDIHITINGTGLSKEETTEAIADALIQYDETLAQKVEGKVRVMQHDPRAADGNW